MTGWLWETLRWTDVLDISIMGYLLYRTLLVLKGTRAIQSVVGLVFVLGLYVLSIRLELASVHWLLEKVFVYIVLAVIILFHQDIRSGLARAGGRFFLNSKPESDVSMLEELVKTSFALASRRIGALIVLEREASLDEYVEPATKLDAVVSQELLQAVFHPTSPLHDGAVVIQKRRMSAAQVYLPLSRSKSVSKFFGTRHRAGIGLTEETDAVVIIVSEERGAVSIARLGTLKPTRDANELREALQDIFQARVAAPDPIAPVEA